METSRLLLFIQCYIFLLTALSDASNCGTARSIGQASDARFEILNDCKFQRSDVELRLALVRYSFSEQAAKIQINCVKGVHVYNASFIKKDRWSITLDTVNVNFDLHGANCSLSGCYDSETINAVFKIPDTSCIIDFDECLPEYCPANVSTCDAAAAAPHGSYTCTCNQTYQEFNYTTNECSCVEGYQESEDGTYCELLITDTDINITTEIESVMYQNETASLFVPIDIVMIALALVIGVTVVVLSVRLRRKKRSIFVWNGAYDSNLKLDVNESSKISQWGSVRTLDNVYSPLEHNDSSGDEYNKTGNISGGNDLSLDVNKPAISNQHSLECNDSPDGPNKTKSTSNVCVELKTDASDSNTCSGTVSNMMDADKGNRERLSADSDAPLTTRRISCTYVTLTYPHLASENSMTLTHIDGLEAPSINRCGQSGELQEAVLNDDLYPQSRELQLPEEPYVPHPITQGDVQEMRSFSYSSGLDLTELDTEAITQGNHLEESGLAEPYVPYPITQ